MTHGDERDLEVLLSYLLNRQLKSSEVILALGISRSAYYDQKEKGTLTSCNNLVAAAQHFGLNPLVLLVPYGHVTPDDIEQYWQHMWEQQGSVDPMGPTRRGGMTTKQLKAEDAERQRVGIKKPTRHLGTAI